MSHTAPGPSRRHVLVAGAGTALGATVLAACGGSSDSTGGSSSAAPASSGNTGAGGGGGSTVLAEVADVPVGGAVSATDSDGKPVLVAQPTEGEVVAFSAICTHMGCTVAPGDKQFECPCHGSTYDLATGDNTGGPAPKPLAKIAVKVEKGEVVET